MLAILLNFLLCENEMNYQEYQIATQGQQIFTVGFTYTPATNSLRVFVNGSKQALTLNYVETNSTTVTMTGKLNAGDIVEFIYITT
jgi:hypothetical protein